MNKVTICSYSTKIKARSAMFSIVSPFLSIHGLNFDGANVSEIMAEHFYRNGVCDVMKIRVAQYKYRGAQQKARSRMFLIIWPSRSMDG